MNHEQNCKHTSFTCEEVNTVGSNLKIAVIRCSDCGEAIGAFPSDMPANINRLINDADRLYKEIRKLPH